MTKKNSIKLGNQTLPIDVSGGYFGELLYDYTGLDILRGFKADDIDNIKKDQKLMKGTIWAAHLAYFKMNRKEPELSFDDVSHLIMCEPLVKQYEIYSELMATIVEAIMPKNEKPQVKGNQTAK